MSCGILLASSPPSCGHMFSCSLWLLLWILIYGGRLQHPADCSDADGCWTTARETRFGIELIRLPKIIHRRAAQTPPCCIFSSPALVLFLDRLQFLFSALSFRAAAAVPCLRVWTAALHWGPLWQPSGPSSESNGPTCLPNACHVQLSEWVSTTVICCNKCYLEINDRNSGRDWV